jgi:microcystin-dependent protein
MSCSNCYNGCPEILSDQCVKYTGIDIPVLGIKNGDSLSYVEQAIITFLTSTLDGSGIKVDISQNIICQTVSKYLPTCGDLTVVDFITAIIKAACDIQGQVTTLKTSTESEIDDINDTLDELNATYTGVGAGTCLTSVNGNSGTHAIVQAVIDQLCNVTNTYVQRADLDDLIAAYFASIPTGSKIYTRMVPYSVLPFYPTTSVMLNFDPTGAGTGDWEKIYLCNGLNGTPDLRGRVPVGATSGMAGNPLSPIVAPGGLNPNYALGNIAGANGVTLSTGQLPAHTHSASATSTSTGTISPNPHTHSFTYTGRTTSATIPSNTIGSADGPLTKTTSDQSLSVSITTSTTVNNANTGGNEAHSNVQPGIGVYYIIYIP